MPRNGQWTAVRPPVEALEHRRLLSGAPAITISDVSRAEGDAGATAFVFSVSLSAPSSKQVSVKYATEGWTAYASDNDFKAAAGTLNFDRGEVTKTITVMVNGDVRVEGDEVFLVNLSGARNAVVQKAWGVGTLFNDDASTFPAPPPYEIPEQPYVDTSESWGPYYLYG